MTHVIEDVTAWAEQEDEQLGSKSKAWLAAPDGRRWLFKHPRPNTGEHWAELVAADIAEALGIPHAYVRLARRGPSLGTISRDFTDRQIKDCTLLHGNQLLASAIVGYEPDAPKPPHHTVDAILDYVAHPGIDRPSGMVPLDGVSSAADAFVGYLMLDAVIGNTDRHHENWGLLQVTWQDQVAGSQATLAGANVAQAFHRQAMELAPTYDHASSLGRDLTDEARQQRLSGRDPRMTVEHYCARGRTPLYGAHYDSRTDTWSESKQITFREAFLRARELSPKVAAAWLRHLASLPAGDLLALVDRVPNFVASEPQRAFAKAALACNLAFLLTLPR